MDKGFTGKLDQAFSAVASKTDHRPSIGIILGSGLGEFASRTAGVEVPFASIPVSLNRRSPAIPAS
jgi:purine nucleoside phosphorylase